MWMLSGCTGPGEVAQEPQVGNGLEKEERTLATYAADKLLRPVLAGLLGEQERDEAVLEAPAPLVVAILHEHDTVPLRKRQATRAALAGRQNLDRAQNVTGRGSCGQARRRAAPLRFAPTVTAPLSV
jgi:hypothetical protein